MRFWSAFASIAILPIVAADFLTATVSCDVHKTYPEHSWAMYPSTVEACEDIINHWTANVIQDKPRGLINGSLCGIDISVDQPKLKYYIPLTELTANCTQGTGGKTCNRASDGASCSYANGAYCYASPMCAKSPPNGASWCLRPCKRFVRLGSDPTGV
ncbi:uncharacterized protein EI90DRAFT_208174 [Cantharellus anzutake]|uniref:uncharacterized protein n=1 Tax=Cantharellus anzutake TaxID=1750568 RepID=UPI001903AA05|nr:uncharacterized protein EI90DRAFT_208174 [Cantharellus anzutake]KAF8317228.1 hypothetical protein EI90DRAFT_208174 [Cantharellus anzutake]